MNKIKGTCALCGKESELTFEHIPPKGAFNFSRAKEVNGKELLTNNNSRLPWDLNGLHYKNLQKGAGKYSLCQECNNNTGSWYGYEYVEVARQANEILNAKNLQNQADIYLQIHPLQFIKQIVSIFCSINMDFQNEKLKALKKFVLNKEQTHLDGKNFRIYMYFTDSSLMRENGFSIVGDINKQSFVTVSEFCATPFGFVLYFEPDIDLEFDGIDITQFCDFKYDEFTMYKMPLIIKEINTAFPLDYRSKEEIERQINRQK